MKWCKFTFFLFGVCVPFFAVTRSKCISNAKWIYDIMIVYFISMHGCDAMRCNLSLLSCRFWRQKVAANAPHRHTATMLISYSKSCMWLGKIQAKFYNYTHSTQEFAVLSQNERVCVCVRQRMHWYICIVWIFYLFDSCACCIHAFAFAYEILPIRTQAHSFAELIAARANVVFIINCVGWIVVIRH